MPPPSLGESPNLHCPYLPHPASDRPLARRNHPVSCRCMLQEMNPLPPVAPSSPHRFTTMTTRHRLRTIANESAARCSITLQDRRGKMRKMGQEEDEADSWQLARVQGRWGTTGQSEVAGRHGLRRAPTGLVGKGGGSSLGARANNDNQGKKMISAETLMSFPKVSISYPTQK